MSDYLNDFHNAQRDEIEHLLAEKKQWLSQPKKGFLRYLKIHESIKHLRAKHLDTSSDVVEIGRREELNDNDFQKVHEAMRAFIPWRKGPFTVFGIEIDAEWRSERKWNRILPVLPDLKNKVIADVGCSNGYYMFRMAHQQPKWVIGFEPYLHHYSAFNTLNTFAGCDNLRIELLGVEHIGFFRQTFDLVFLMGILYHRKSPVEALENIKAALNPGGIIIIESQSIPGEDPVALSPEKTYAKAPGTYFVPTANCLKNWMLRAGFTEVEIFFSHPMSSDEQRRTDWMTFESYEDFIDPRNPAVTIEGYPAPLRVFLKGKVPN